MSALARPESGIADCGVLDVEFKDLTAKRFHEGKPRHLESFALHQCLQFAH